MKHIAVRNGKGDITVRRNLPKSLRRLVETREILLRRRVRFIRDPRHTQQAYEEWCGELQKQEDFTSLRDERGCLYWHRVTEAVLRYYFHAGYSTKGAREEIMGLFVGTKWKGVEMMGRVQIELRMEEKCD